MNKSTVLKVKPVYFIIICVFLLVFSQLQIEKERRRLGFDYLFAYQPGNLMNVALLAGFRGIAADILMIQIDDLHHRGQWYKILPLFYVVTYIQPNFLLGWSLGAWHMSFNLYVYSKDSKDQIDPEVWINKGIEFIKDGIQKNPKTYELYFEAGWIYYQKKKDYAAAASYFAQACQWPHPQYVQHMLAHSLEKSGDLRSALKTWQELRDSALALSDLKSVVQRNVDRLEKLVNQIRL